MLQRGILFRRENSKQRCWALAPVAAARRGFKMVLFTASRGNNFVGGTCALPSALLVLVFYYINIFYVLYTSILCICSLHSDLFSKYKFDDRRMKPRQVQHCETIC